MKRFVFLSSLLALGLSTQAQTFSAGARTGLNSFISIGNGPRPSDIEPTGGYLTNVTGTVFGRYSGKKKWGIEAGLSYAVMNQAQASLFWTYYNRTEYIVSDYYLLDVSAQYELSCAKWANNDLLKRLHIYLGAGATIGLVDQTYSVTEYVPEARNIVTGGGTSWGAMLLLTQMATYRLNKEFSFVVSSELRTMPWQWNRYSERNSMSAIQLGLMCHID